MTAALLLLGRLAVGVAAASGGLQLDEAIERHRRSLVANPDSAAAKVALKRLIDRPGAVPREEDEQIRQILRQHPWSGKASLILEKEPGQPLIVSGVVRDPEGRPIARAVLNVFQTDANGHYTRGAPMDEPHARLFAFIRTGSDGAYEFTTIRPGGYPGRPDRQGEQWRIPEHIHFQTTAASHQSKAFQMVFNDDARMTAYWREWAARGKHPIVSVVRGRDGVQRAICNITLLKAI